MALITQAQLQAGIKTGLDAVTIFNSAATIEGDELLDDSTSNLPFALIMTASSYDLQPAPGRMVGTYTIPVIIFVEFENYEDSRKALRDTEQAVHDYFFTTGEMWSASGLSGVNLRRITAGDIGEVLPPSTDGQPFPVFLTRIMDFELELF